MARKWAVVFVGIVGVLLSYGVSRFSGGSAVEAPDPGAHDATELQRLKAQVRELEASVATSERLAREAQVAARAASARVETLPAPEPAPEETADARPSGEDTKAAPREVDPNEVVEKLDARFFSEALDPGWSGEARQRAQRLGGLLPEGSRVVSLECRSSMCRLELSHPSLESFQGFVREGLMGTGNDWDGPFMAALTGDPKQPGGVQAVAYLARAGADLSPDALDSP